MLSKSQIKHITALRTKKYRLEHSQFFVEGRKSVGDLLASEYNIVQIFYTKECQNATTTANNEIITEIDSFEYEKISAQKNPEGILAVVDIPTKKDFKWQNQQYIALDQLRDPGNMGTIIRLADWFGIKNIICSSDSVDCYNPKVIQASMGSIFKVNVHYTELSNTLAQTTSPLFAATLDGTNVYKQQKITAGTLVIGNEANGISAEVLSFCQNKITIPSKGQAESLNAAMACGILCSHLFA